MCPFYKTLPILILFVDVNNSISRKYTFYCLLFTAGVSVVECSNNIGATLFFAVVLVVPVNPLGNFRRMV
jgi:hypothetical protein